MNQQEAIEKGLYHVIGKEIDKRYIAELKKLVVNQKAIDENAGCKWTKLCIIPVVGKLFIETAHILRKFFKTKYKRVFYL